jgi:hypothetical protein
MDQWGIEMLTQAIPQRDLRTMIADSKNVISIGLDWADANQLYICPFQR